jgi:hypothetical protein
VGSSSNFAWKAHIPLGTPFVFFSITFRGTQEQNKAMIDPYSHASA